MTTRNGVAINPKVTRTFHTMLLVSAMFLAPHAIAAPDLTITSVNQNPVTPDVGEGEIVATIANTGSSGTTLFINLDITFYIDGFVCDTASILGGLGAGKSKTKSTENCNPALPGPHIIQVLVDSTYEVEESNESNNIVETQFLWYDAALCDQNESCNGKDDNCNGLVDESFSLLGQACDGDDNDACKQGTYVCAPSQDTLFCEEPVGILNELCNGKDDDCDGGVDEDFPEVGQPCVEQKGTCTVEGTWACHESELTITCEGTPISGGIEYCNGIDDDCDDSTDEDFIFVGSTCLEGAGLYRQAGTFGCAMNEAYCSATPSPPPTQDELCGNLEDDNCNELVDENCDCIPGSYLPCGSSIGACEYGIMECGEDGTFPLKCIGATLPTTEICDNSIDDDCDGSIDEGCTCTTGQARLCTPGAGVCSSGVQTCIKGVWGPCAPTLPPSEEVCDGLDNDCDGIRDEGCTCYPGAISKCAIQRDGCAEYFQICMETLNWSPCLAKPGSEDPTCGEEPEDVTSGPSEETDTAGGENNGFPQQPPTGWNATDYSDTTDSSGKKIVVIQQEEAGCKTSQNAGLPLLWMWIGCALVATSRVGRKPSGV